MKRLIVLAVLPFFLLACGEKAPPPETEVATSPATPPMSAERTEGAGPERLDRLSPGSAPADSSGGSARGGTADGTRVESARSGGSMSAGSAMAGADGGAGSAAGSTGRGGAAETAVLPSGSPEASDSHGARDPGVGRDPASADGSGEQGAARAERASAADAASTGIHEVVQGDTLVAIAEERGIELAQLRAWNPGIDPRRLRIGQQIRLTPQDAAASSPRVHRVKEGDTMYSIAREHRISLVDLQGWNPQANPRRLRVGQSLQLAPR
jgi:peptidoglycan endopeptidase LytF